MYWAAFAWIRESVNSDPWLNYVIVALVFHCLVMAEKSRLMASNLYKKRPVVLHTFQWTRPVKCLTGLSSLHRKARCLKGLISLAGSPERCLVLIEIHLAMPHAT